MGIVVIETPQEPAALTLWSIILPLHICDHSTILHMFAISVGMIPTEQPQCDHEWLNVAADNSVRTSIEPPYPCLQYNLLHA